MQSLVKEVEKSGTLANPTIVAERLKQELAVVNPSQLTVNPVADKEIISQVEGWASLVLSDKALALGDNIREEVGKLGLEAQNKALRYSAILNRPVDSLKKIRGGGQELVTSIKDLNDAIEPIDPSKVRLLKSKALGLFKKLPLVGMTIDAFIDQVVSVQSQIQGVQAKIVAGEIRVKKNNEILVLDRNNLRDALKPLQEELKKAMAFRDIVQAKYDEITNSELQQFVAKEVLYPIGERIKSMLQTAQLCYMGVLLFSTSIENNRNLLMRSYNTRNNTVLAINIATTNEIVQNDWEKHMKNLDNAEEVGTHLMENTANRMGQQLGTMEKDLNKQVQREERLRGAFTKVLEGINDFNAFYTKALEQQSQMIESGMQAMADGEAAVRKIEVGQDIRKEIGFEK